MSESGVNRPEIVVPTTREEFGEIVRRYQNMVSAVTFSVSGNLQQSEDLAQETFVAAWLNLKELRDPQKLPAWLCGIARNLSHNWRRKTETERLAKCPTSLEELPEKTTYPDLGIRLQREEQAALLWATLEKIPETYREPLVMFYRQEQSVSEIAAALEISEDNVRQRLVRGRSYLTEEVQNLVQSALETLRPDAGFTLAVLAALPAITVATASNAVAATTGTAGTGSVFGKGLSWAGVGLASWLVGMIWLGFVSLLLPIAAIWVGTKGPLIQIRNSPTVRSRRYLIFQGMISAGIALFLMGAYFFIMSFPTEVISILAKTAWIFVLALLFFYNILFGALFVNRYWRRIIEEDLGRISAPQKPLENSRLSKASLRLCFAFAFFLVCCGAFGLLKFQWSILQNIPSPVFGWCVLGFVVLLYLYLLFMFTFLYIRGMEMASDEGVEKYPPLIPDILDVVLGKKEMPSDKATLRARFGADMIGMGALIFSTSALPVMLGLMQPNPWVGYVIIGVSLLGFALFAKYIAGKPKVRQLGWGFTCLFFMFFYGWVNWFALRETLTRFPEAELAVLFIYVLFFFCSAGAFLGYFTLFEKEINKKWGLKK